MAVAEEAGVKLYAKVLQDYAGSGAKPRALTAGEVVAITGEKDTGWCERRLYMYLITPQFSAS